MRSTPDVVPAHAMAISPDFPADPADLKRPISYDAMREFLQEVSDHHRHITLSVAGESVEGRPLYLVHLSHDNQPLNSDWRVFLFGLQHGNEPAGKDALLYLIREIAQNPGALPDGVDLWIMPSVNPDGGEADRRTNSNDFDLNRDHQLLSQPETQALHAAFRDIMPHAAVDCHEFRRDTGDYLSKGWSEWPIIMMDCGNHPLCGDPLYEAGLQWVEGAEPAMEAEGHNYTRYYVGSAPPEGELRYSTLDTDDARNAFAAYGTLSFIIESGVYRGAEDPHADLHERVQAYLTLLRRFLTYEGSRIDDRAIVEAARSAAPPRYIPTNVFWGSDGLKVTPVKVVSLETSETLTVDTPNFMTDRIVKNAVEAPKAYLISSGAAQTFSTLLKNHGLLYDELDREETFTVESVKLERLEENYDDLYNRYDGRQISSLGEPQPKTFPAGSLRVELSRRAALLLEPTSLFGLYQWPEYKALVARDGTMPVFREVDAK
ncbi:MAG: M14 family zinc carboxypeptidase [Sumerlaeia bacterium]